MIAPRLRILDLEILAIANRLIVTAQEREGAAGRPIAEMVEQPWHAEAIAHLSREVQRALHFQREASSTRTRLEQLGLELFDLLFGPRIKSLIRTSQASHLVLRLQSSLLDIPWELLHTGEEFWSLKFAMGRTVKLGGAVGTPLETGRERSPGPPYGMLILCDPKGDLPHAAQEGLRLLRSLGSSAEAVRVDLLASPITHRQVVEELRRYDLVHYAGHAVGLEQGPSGWLLDDAPFTAGDITRMSGSRAFPALIFANACLSGSSEGFGDDALPRALLGAGVQHYIGATSDLPDMTGARVAARFYPALLRGESVGQALRQARLEVAGDVALPPLAWAGYVLYGDPTDRYFDGPAPAEEGGTGGAGEASGARAVGGAGEAGQEPAVSSRAMVTPAGGAGAGGPMEMGGAVVLPAVSPPGGRQTRPEEPGDRSGRDTAGQSAEADGVSGDVAGAEAGPSSAATSGGGARPAGAATEADGGASGPATPAGSAGETAGPAAGTAGSAGEARARTVSSVRLALAGLVGLVLAVLSLSGALSAFDLVWEWSRYLGHADRPGLSSITLLSIRPDRMSQAREVYAELLEHLNAFGVSPRLVAFDSWIADEQRPAQDERLIQAIAASIERFPVIFGLENETSSGAMRPPPAWFERRLKEVVAVRTRARCERLAKATSDVSDESEARLKDCEASLTQTYYAKHMLWGNLWIERPRSIFEPLGLRVPLLHRGAAGLAYQRPHFAVLLAHPERGGIDPGSSRYRSVEDPALVEYDARGGMPVVFAGRASWDGEGTFPAWELEAVLARWRRGEGAEGAGSADRGAGLEPRQLNEQRVLVGAAAPASERRGNEMDQYSTPIGRMFGVEVHANIAESLLERRVPRPVPAFAALLGPCAAGLASAWAGARGRHRRLWVAAVVAAVLAGSSLLLVFQIAFPPAAGVLAALAGGWLGGMGRRGVARPAVAALLGVVLLGTGRVEAGEVPARAGGGGKSHPSTVAPGPGAAKAAATPGRPAPPAPPAPHVLAAGWRLVDLKPRDLLSRRALTASSDAPSSASPATESSAPTGGAPSIAALSTGATLEPGTVLRSTDAAAEVLVEYVDPVQGMIAHHALFGKFEATLAADGELRFASGTIWTRLFRYLEQAAGALTVQYDGTPAGFGSTEVVYDRAFPFGRDLYVLEGRVLFQRRGGEAVLEAGQGTRWGSHPGASMPIPAEKRVGWIERGSQLELSLLPPDRRCAGQIAALSGATLVSGACFDDVAARDRAFREGRAALGARMSPAAWRKMGDAYLAAAQLELAADSYRRGLKDGSDPVEAGRMALELGNVRWAAGDPEQARGAFEEAVKHDPALAGAWNNLGVLQWRDGRLAEAQASLERATRIDPAQYQAWRNLGRVALEQRPAEAAAAWEQAARLSGGDAGLWKDLSLAYAADHRYDQAVEAAGRSTRIDPAQADLWYALAQWYWAQGRKAESIDAYQRAEELEMKAGGK